MDIVEESQVELKVDTSIKLVSWPTPQDYNEAVQGPVACFDDPDLKCAEPELNALGLPKPASGNFATVYQFKDSTSGSAYAVRCFLRRVGDAEQARYAAIAEYLETKRLPYFVPFEYQREGIRVSGHSHPVVKMAWARGCTLGEYVARNAENAEVLIRLRDKLAAMVAELQSCEIAHGDLQHANIMVDESGTADGDIELRLVDYDGVYVPAFKTDTASELGHRNYQHPRRRSEHFGPYLDNFSAWLIYESLTVLSLDPSLYARFGGGDECLIFREADLKQPTRSVLLKLLFKHPLPEVRASVGRLVTLLRMQVDEVPPLGAAVEESDLPELKPVPEIPVAPEQGTHTRNEPVLSGMLMALAAPVLLVLALAWFAVVKSDTTDPYERARQAEKHAVQSMAEKNWRSAVVNWETAVDRYVADVRHSNGENIARCSYQEAIAHKNLGNTSRERAALNDARRLVPDEAIQLRNEIAEEFVSLDARDERFADSLKNASEIDPAWFGTAEHKELTQEAAHSIMHVVVGHDAFPDSYARTLLNKLRVNKPALREIRSTLRGYSQKAKNTGAIHETSLTPTQIGRLDKWIRDIEIMI